MFSVEIEVLKGPKPYVLVTSGLVTEEHGKALVRYFVHHGISAKLRRHSFGDEGEDRETGNSPGFGS
jgi:hypothetical protein